VNVFLFRPMPIAIVVLALALTGCLGGQSPPTNFYLLSPMSPSPTGTNVESAAPVYIGLETVVIAEYLNRNEIVLNLDNTVYQLAEFNQWAEPLDDNLTRVLETNLTRLLHADSIEIFMASQSSILLDYRLEIDVLRLDGNLADNVTLVVQWALLEAEEDELILLQRSQYEEPAADETVRSLVLAQSRTVDKLSRDIAAAVRQALAK